MTEVHLLSEDESGCSQDMEFGSLILNKLIKINISLRGSIGNTQIVEWAVWITYCACDDIPARLLSLFVK